MQFRTIIRIFFSCCILSELQTTEYGCQQTHFIITHLPLKSTSVSMASLIREIKTKPKFKRKKKGLFDHQHHSELKMHKL